MAQYILEPAQKRPLGLSIIAWIALVGGVLGLISGIIVIAVGIYILPELTIDGGLDELMSEDVEVMERISDAEFTGFILRAGIYAIAVSAAFTAMGIGIFKKARWVWKLAVGMMVIMAAISVSSLFVDFIGLPSFITEMYNIYSAQSLPGLIASTAFNVGIYLLVLYYLFRPHVRQYLGRQEPTL